MCGHHLVEPDSYNFASGWEKGIVEKNLEDRRRQVWAELREQRWNLLGQLNEALSDLCSHLRTNRVGQF